MTAQHIILLWYFELEHIKIMTKDTSEEKTADFVYPPNALFSGPSQKKFLCSARLCEAEALEQRRQCTRTNATTSNFNSHTLTKWPQSRALNAHIKEHRRS